MVQKESVGIFGGGNGKKVAAQLGHYEVPESIPVLGPDGNVLKNTFKKCYKSGAVFEGELENGLKSGKGKMELPTGVTYEGSWRDNMRWGKGTLKWADGGSYTGEFVSDERHGFGHQKFPNGESYEGQFFKDKKHGRGTYTWPDGTKFTGRFYKNDKEGYGKFQFPDKSTFKGLYKENERCGPGVFTYSDGTEDCGIWKREQLMKICSSMRDAFSIIDFPEFEYDPKEHEMILSSADASSLIVAEKTMSSSIDDTQMSVSTPESSAVKGVRFDDDILESIVTDLYSTRLPSIDARHLKYDQSEFDNAYFAECVNKSKNESDVKSAVALNKTPAFVAMQRHVLRHHYWESEQEFNVQHMMVGNRSGIGDKGPIERASEMLHFAALQGDNELVLKILRLKACYVDVMDRDGNTPVHLAAINGHSYVLNTLLNFGADINRLTNEGVSALCSCHVLFYDVADFKPNAAESLVKAAASRNSEGGGDDDDDGTETSEARLERLRLNARRVRLKKRALTNKRYCTQDEFESVDMAYKPLVKKTQTGLGGSASGPPKEGVSQKSGTTGTSEQHAEESAPPVKKAMGNTLKPDGGGVHGTVTESGTSETDGKGAAVGEAGGAADVSEAELAAMQAELDAVGELAERLSVTQKETVSELHSTQSLYNFKIEVTAQMLDKTAHNLSENERLRHSLMASGTNQEKRDPGTVRELALKKIRRKALEEMIRLLLRRGANPNASMVPFPVLFFALKTADPDGVANLLSKGASTETRLPKEKGGLAPLHIAVTLPGEAGVQITKLLLEAGANPNIQAYPYDSEPDISMNVDDSQEENQRTALEILSLDRQPVEPVVGGNTPLSYACQRDEDYVRAREIINLLLAHNANCNVLNPVGLSPLAQLIISGNDTGIDELLDHEADPSLTLTHANGSALCVASSTEYEFRRSPEARIQLIDKLMSAGANILSPIVFGSPGKTGSVGTAVDYAYHKYYLDKRVAFLPYHALSPAERDIFNARKDLLTHLGNLLRRTVVKKEYERLVREEQENDRSVSPSDKFFHSGYGANTPLGIVKPNRGTSADVIRIMSIKDNMVTVDATEKMMTKDEVQKILRDGKLRIRKPLFKYCYECGRSSGVKLVACTRCKEVFYCGKQCKLKAWNTRHKDECVRLANKERPDKDRTKDLDRIDSPTPTTEVKPEDRLAQGNLTDMLLPKPKVISVVDETNDSRKQVKMYPRRETYDKKGNPKQNLMRNDKGEVLTENYSFI
ncbi:ankyrin repeat and MYND domain-containing protein 1-like isoform X2 [Convolutriloba macropyga]|uniref:ankyrin repeat and MYND domain-containing protein 1-like isoform X2 n=1 Tax=Convolutriloba macropyga TaxID=536237 RepID=UPI003F51BBA6